MAKKVKIEEAIVVEGRDDSNSINRAVEAYTIETHGFGIKKETWDLLEKAYEKQGLIVFTDPDHAGEEIRKRILKKFPESKEAFLKRDKAIKAGDVGIENAEPEDIVAALEKARSKAAIDKNEASTRGKEPFTMADLVKAGLAGGPDSKEKRRQVGEKLGIGYGNGNSFLKKLNAFGITREEFDEAT